MRYLSLCSGIEAATVAWHPMGWEPAAFAEIEAFPAAVLRHHYPNTPNLGDMTKWREWNVGAIDLLVGGTPCQSFSVAGLRKGLSDPRGGLMLTFLEIAQSLRPRWVVWENVPGVLSSGGGRDFGSFLGALGELGYGWAYRVLDAQWCRVDGYERAVPQRRRRVFVVGCIGDQARAAKVLFERQSVERNTAPRRAKGQGAATDAEDGARTGGCYWDGSDCAATLKKQNASGAQRMPDKANFGAVLQPICIDRSAYNQGQNAKWDCPIEQSDAMFGLIARGPHAVAVPYRKSHRAASATDDERGVRAETANTLNRFDTGERDTHAIAFTPGNLSRGAGPSPNSEVAPTQKCSAGRGADDQRTCVAHTLDGGHGATEDGTGRGVPLTVAVSFDWQKGNDVGNPRPSTMNIAEEHSMTLGTTRVPAVAHGFYSTGGTHGVNMEPEVSPAVKVGSGLGIPSPPAVAFKPSHFTRGKDGSPTNITPPLSADADKEDQDTVVAYPIDTQNMTEHHSSGGLGFGQRDDPSFTITKGHSHAVAAIAPSLTASDDHSRSPQSAEVTQQIAAVHQATMVVRRLTPVECERLQGFPDDYTNIPWRGKPESPDGPRYKALGNSMAVNCMRWIGRRIDAVEKGTELPA